MADLPSLRPAVYTVVVYEYVDNMLERRKPHREAHLERVHATKARGELVNAGAIGEAERAMFVFAPGTDDRARAFVERDPYVLAGLVSEWTVTTWNVVE
jgi:uncharacterized protein YciI